ncbi:MAG TPA: LysR family transcriptional regulator [Chitinophagaceae bacterium]|jgi:DNA-binding transcriptional LysR family regulator|nr:LysR family transcriptional regulator [Chitinophagaceae bacterium]HCT24047.1 LysR family transcriptional regulator [Chitinophagaceae bacterium]
MNYTLHQLAIFLKVCEKKSITKAAEELNLTQPAVSIQLRNFQQQFSTALTEIIGKQLYITDYGQDIARVAERILTEASSIEMRRLGKTDQLTGRLRISSVSTGKYVMPYFLTNFLQKNNGVTLELDVSNKAQVIQQLEKNETDFALVSVIPRHLQVRKVELMENTLLLIGPQNTRKTRNPISREALAQLPFIFREEGSATRMLMERFLTQSKVYANKKITLTSNEAVKQAVLAGLGYSVMPLIGIRNELHSQQLQIISAKGLPIQTSWNLVWLSNKKLSPVATAYVQYLQAEKNKIIKQHFS